MRAIKAIKRWMVVVPVIVMTILGVLAASLLWLFLGEKACKYTFPLESFVDTLMSWAEK